MTIYLLPMVDPLIVDMFPFVVFYMFPDEVIVPLVDTFPNEVIV